MSDGGSDDELGCGVCEDAKSLDSCQRTKRDYERRRGSRPESTDNRSEGERSDRREQKRTRTTEVYEGREETDCETEQRDRQTDCDKERQ